MTSPAPTPDGITRLAARIDPHELTTLRTKAAALDALAEIAILRGRHHRRGRTSVPTKELDLAIRIALGH